MHPLGARALATGLGLAVALGACGGPSASPAPTVGEALFPEQAERSVANDLARDHHMQFAPAGPHHVLGTAPDGVQLDVVGHPADEVVLSVPAGPGVDAGGLAAPYLPAAVRLIGGPPDELVAWIEDRLDGWHAADELLATTAIGGTSVELRTIGSPRYLRLRLVRGGLPSPSAPAPGPA